MEIHIHFYQLHCLVACPIQFIKLFSSLLIFLIVVFLYLIYLSIFIFHINFLPNDGGKAVSAENGPTINPTPVTDSVTDVAVGPIRTAVTVDTDFDVSV